MVRSGSRVLGAANGARCDGARLAAPEGQRNDRALAGIAVYAGGQAVGYWLGSAVPYVSDNPEHLTDPSQPLWVIHYPAYVLQAIVLYLATTLAVAVYGWRMRTLSLQPSATVVMASPN
ncbi:hypothetical protein ACQFYA_02775 [Promicromonospora sp. Marseille-Q5078]